MTPAEAAGLIAAGIGAGAINSVVGSGTLITFPALLAVGLPPVSANVTNTVGLVPGSLAAAWGYRRELGGQRRRLLRLGSASLLGGLLGAVLLLRLPSSIFDAVVPVLVLAACALVLAQPWIAARVAARPEPLPGAARLLWAGVFGAGMYGGYFGAAQGVLLIGLLGALMDPDLHRVNAVKNILAGVVNGCAAVIFVAVADVRWDVAGLVAGGAIAGGLLGARYGRRLPAGALRILVALVGVVAVVILLAG